MRQKSRKITRHHRSRITMSAALRKAPVDDRLRMGKAAFAARVRSHIHSRKAGIARAVLGTGGLLSTCRPHIDASEHRAFTADAARKAARAVRYLCNNLEHNGFQLAPLSRDDTDDALRAALSDVAEAMQELQRTIRSRAGQGRGAWQRVFDGLQLIAPAIDEPHTTNQAPSLDARANTEPVAESESVSMAGSSATERSKNSGSEECAASADVFEEEGGKVGAQLAGQSALVASLRRALLVSRRTVASAAEAAAAAAARQEGATSEAMSVRAEVERERDGAMARAELERERAQQHDRAHRRAEERERAACCKARELQAARDLAVSRCDALAQRAEGEKRRLTVAMEAETRARSIAERERETLRGLLETERARCRASEGRLAALERRLARALSPKEAADMVAAVEREGREAVRETLLLRRSAAAAAANASAAREEAGRVRLGAERRVQRHETAFEQAQAQNTARADAAATRVEHEAKQQRARDAAVRHELETERARCRDAVRELARLRAELVAVRRHHRLDHEATQ